MSSEPHSEHPACTARGRVARATRTHHNFDAHLRCTPAIHTFCSRLHQVVLPLGERLRHVVLETHQLRLVGLRGHLSRDKRCVKHTTNPHTGGYGARTQHAS